MFEKKDFGNDSTVLGFISQVGTGDVTGATCDMKDYDGCLVSVNVGNSGDTLSGSVKIELEVQACDDNSSWVPVADALVSNSVTATETGTIALIDAPAEDSLVVTAAYLGRQRYVRVVASFTGTHSNGTPISASYLRTRKA
jgi:hypothetical protein